jgi:hypothetical protein
MKIFISVSLLCLLLSSLALADTSGASLIAVKRNHHGVRHHHAHKAGKHHAPKHRHNSI